MKHISVVELAAPDCYLFKVGEKNHDWDERKVPVYTKQVQVGNETVLICVTYQPLLRLCLEVIKSAYQEASFGKWRKTWYAVKDGYLYQAVVEFDHETVVR